jgi:hypothetical protein
MLVSVCGLANLAPCEPVFLKRDEPGWTHPSRFPYKPDTPVGFYRPTVLAVANELRPHSSPSISDRKACRPRPESSNRTVDEYASLPAIPAVV